jgi:hypothetical protein
MRHVLGWSLFALAIGSGCGAPTTPQQRLAWAEQELAAGGTEEKRFYALNTAAKGSFRDGRIDDARKYAEELSALTPKFEGDWNYGNAVQDVHVVLGRIAVVEGRLEDAKRHLLEAGRSPGSPQMDTFGPNMSLAKDLVERGERDTVVAYFELCRKFWDLENGRLDQWRRDVEAGKTPDFGANLNY